MNDFAGPIIQAFMQGQQMKRQTQQDVIAAQEREKEAKRYMDSLKRMEQQDKLQLALGTFQLQDMVRNQIGAGTRTIPTMPGMQAQTMGPVAQQLMDASGSPRMPQPEMQAPDANQNPLDYSRSPEQLMRSSLEQIPELQQPANLPELLNNPQVAMQLGKEFNIPRASTPEQKMFDAGPFGQIDMSQFPSYEETRARKQGEALSQLGIKGLETQIIKAAEEPFNMAKDSRAMQRGLAVAGVGATTRKEIAENTNQVKREIAASTNEIQRDAAKAREIQNARMYELAQSKLAATLAKLSANTAAAGPDIDATVNEFKTGVMGKDDVSKVPMKLRNPLYKRLQDAGVTMLSDKQKAGVEDFFMLKNFGDTVRELSDVYSQNRILGNDIIGPVADVKRRMRATLEPVARKFDYKGVITDKDVENLMGFATTKFTSKAEDLKRIALIDRFMVHKFNATYPAGSVGLTQRRELARRAGVENLIFPEVK